MAASFGARVRVIDHPWNLCQLPSKKPCRFPLFGKGVGKFLKN